MPAGKSDPVNTTGSFFASPCSAALPPPHVITAGFAAVAVKSSVMRLVERSVQFVMLLPNAPFVMEDATSPVVSCVWSL